MERIMVLDNLKPYGNYVWECPKPSMIECEEEFLKSKLWNGKTFMEIQRDVTWTD